MKTAANNKLILSLATVFLANTLGIQPLVAATNGGLKALCSDFLKEKARIAQETQGNEDPFAGYNLGPAGVSPDITLVSHATKGVIGGISCAGDAPELVFAVNGARVQIKSASFEVGSHQNIAKVTGALARKIDLAVQGTFVLNGEENPVTILQRIVLNIDPKTGKPIFEKNNFAGVVGLNVGPSGSLVSFTSDLPEGYSSPIESGFAVGLAYEPSKLPTNICLKQGGEIGADGKVCGISNIDSEGFEINLAQFGKLLSKASQGRKVNVGDLSLSEFLDLNLK